MNILGITNGETSSACLIKNGKLVAAVSEERFSRIKQDNSWPTQSINYVLKSNGLNLKKIDKVAYCWFKGFDENKILLSYFDRIVYEAKNNYNGLSLFRDRIQVELERDKIKAAEFYNFLKKNNISHKSEVISHHDGHLYSTFCFSQFNQGLILTSDGRGDFESLTISEFDGLKIKHLYSATSNDSLGTFYARISKLLGFIPHRHEGKVTGLSARGDYKKCIHLMRKMIVFKNGKIFAKTGEYFKSFHDDYGKYKAWNTKIRKKILKYSREDIAAAAQKHLEDIVLKIVKFYQKKTGKKNICLAGGVFANVLLNQKILQLKNINNIFVQPQMGDGGLALGAAAGLFLKMRKKKIKWKNMYLGPSYELKKQYINRLEKKYKVNFIRIKNLPSYIVENLYKNRVIGLFQGRMEFGPRALCNRSIIYHCFDKKINHNLNQRLNRSEFMPFAPVTLDKFANKAFLNWRKNHRSSHFMTTTYKCSKFMKQNCPAVVHVDGTARPQILKKTDNQLMYKIILNWKKKTNQIALLNTSFNHHEEPIVCSPEDGIKSYLKNNVDILIIDKYLVTKNNAL